MDRKYPNALAYIKIEAVIRVKQKLWAVKIWAKMIWKQPSSFSIKMCHENMQVEFEFGSGRIIFGTVMPLALRKIPIMGHKNT